MALEAAAAAYVADRGRALGLLAACHKLQQEGRTIRVPQAALHAHWDTDEGMDTLQLLSNSYRIVPQPLGDFIEHCLRRHVSILDFLHPCSLFEDAELATRVYCYLGNTMGPQYDVLEVLWYLAGTRSSNPYAPYIMDMLYEGISASVPENCRYLLALASRYMGSAQIAQLDMGALGRMMPSGSLVANVMALARRMEPCQRVLLAKPMAHVAACGADNGQVVFQLQRLSCEPEHAAAVAAAVRSYRHCPYVDRLGDETMIHLVPYLVQSQAFTGLLRLAVSRPRFAVSSGVFTALLSAGRAVPEFPDPVAHPSAPHEVVYYLHRKLELPPDPSVVDAAYDSDAQAADVMRKTSRRCPALRDYLLRVERWRRRRGWVVALRREPQCPLLQWLAAREFTWRLVFRYL